MRTPFCALVLTCMTACTGSQHDADKARDLIATAIEAMGGSDKISAIENLAVRAECTGPDGPFVTEIISAKPDRVYMRQEQDGRISESVVVGDLGWTRHNKGRYEPLSAPYRYMIRGHEFHFMLFDINRRFSNHIFTGKTKIGDRRCLNVTMTDNDGQPASICFDESSKLPIAMTLVPPSDLGRDKIEIVFDKWQRIGQVLYISSFTLTDGEKIFTYQYRDYSRDLIDNQIFAVPPELGSAKGT